MNGGFTSYLICRIISLWHIPILANSDREQLQSPQPAPEPVLRTAHCTQHARTAAFPNIRTPGCGFHARWRNPDTGDFLVRSWLGLRETWFRRNLAASLMSQRNEKAPRIICKIGLGNVQERVALRGDGGCWWPTVMLMLARGWGKIPSPSAEIMLMPW